MREKAFTPNDNYDAVRLLARQFGKYNKGRNRILIGAAALCIITLTVIFGITYGKIQAEYLKAVREAGTTASAFIEDADIAQYSQVRVLGYIKHAGRRAGMGTAYAGGSLKEHAVCTLQWLDTEAWEDIIRPAYTDLHGRYPEQGQEIMFSARTLEALHIEVPKEGMKITLSVTVGLFRSEEEEFILSGWFTEYSNEAVSRGYISREKAEDWGYDVDESAEIMLCQADYLNAQETENRLYRDIQMRDSGQQITVSDSFSHEAVRELTGGYAAAAVGGLSVLCAMFFLVYNVMQISMTGDIRQMGMLHMTGATEKQIRQICFRQIRHILAVGCLIGSGVSAGILLLIVPLLTGKQYLSGYGGRENFQVFRPGILAAALLFTVTLILGASAAVIRRVVSMSCVESAQYTGLVRLKKKQGRGKRRNGRKNRLRRREGARKESTELFYMAWCNLTRHKGRFLLTVLSLFLGMAALLAASVISSGSDYGNAIAQRPDFVIAGQFSEWGREEGYGREYKTRDAGEDPFLTKGSMIALLYDNEYDEFSPVSKEVKEQLMSLDGVDTASSYIMEGGYLNSVVSRKGILPILTESGTETISEQSVRQGDEPGSADEPEMIEGWEPDVVQVLKEEEIAELESYVKEHGLSADLESFKNGNGVLILHDHALSLEQEEMAQQSIGEPVYFTTLPSREERVKWNTMTDEERRVWEEGDGFHEKKSGTFTLCGYLDNRAEDFPNLRQTWHGDEGIVYFLISEAGFEKIPTEKKTLCMELNVREGWERRIKGEIEKIISAENQRRNQTRNTGIDAGTGETGIFCIRKSDLEAEASGYIRGNRLVLGCISIVLLFGGLTNYFNVMAAGLVARKKEFEILESVGMTGKQKRKMLMAEGGYYCLLAAALLLTIGNAILGAIRLYMEQKLSYFVFRYPINWLLLLFAGLAVICLGVPVIMNGRGKE